MFIYVGGTDKHNEDTMVKVGRENVEIRSAFVLVLGVETLQVEALKRSLLRS